MATTEASEEKPHISVSQMEMYLRCPQAWYFRYIEGMKRPPGMAAHIGTGVHAGAEVNFTQKIESRVDLPREQIVEVSVANFEHRLEEQGVALSEDEKAMGAAAAKGKATDNVAMLAGWHRDNVQATYQPIETEHRFRIELPKLPRDLVGVVDFYGTESEEIVAAKNAGKPKTPASELKRKRAIESAGTDDPLANEPRIVSDFKTSGKSKNQDEADHSVQLTAYAVAAFRKYGEFPARLQLDVAVNLKKGPKRQVLITRRNAGDFKAFSSRMVETVKAMETGVYPPAPAGSWWCGPKWCGFWNECPHVNSNRDLVTLE